MADRVTPEKSPFAIAKGDFRFLWIDNDGHTVADTVSAIRAWASELYGA